MNEPSQLVSFYRGAGTDHAGRRISEIHSFPFHKLESCHDFIQWLFPLMVRSAFNPDAPIMTEEERFEFHHDPLARANYRISLARMLDFFGYFENEKGDIVRTALWWQLAPKWLSPENHNAMRATRILRSCMLCGFVPQALAFHKVLIVDSRAMSGDWKRPLDFWRDAVSVIPATPER
jgi:hypothetical protein